MSYFMIDCSTIAIGEVWGLIDDILKKVMVGTKSDGGDKLRMATMAKLQAWELGK